MNKVEKEILTLEQELTQTEMRLDVEALDRIYADDIMVTAPIGICVDKPAVMTEVREAADKATVEKYDKDDLKVRAYGETAAVTSYRITAKARFEETDINAKFLEPDGTLSKDIMPDLLHPNEKGYEIWAEAIEAKVKELMKS